MAEGKNHLVLFDEIDQAVEALDVLRECDLPEGEMEILSGEPYKADILGRPGIQTNVPLIGITGFLVGLVIAFALVWGTPQQYPIQVGAQPLFPIPPWLVLTFEFSMLGLLVGTFLGVIWENDFPSFGHRIYDQRISDGRTGLVFSCPEDGLAGIRSRLKDLGGNLVEDVEERRL